MFETDEDLVALREPFTREFHELFESGCDAYLAGDWPKAKEILQQTIVTHLKIPF